MKLFQNRMIYFINYEVKSISEALITSCLPLFNNEYFNKKYFDQIIEKFKIDSESLILNDKVIILHNKPDKDSVFKNGVSLVYFSSPLEIKNRKINFFITISALDEDSSSFLFNKTKAILDNEENIFLLSNQKNLKNFVDKLSLIDN